MMQSLWRAQRPHVAHVTTPGLVHAGQMTTLRPAGVVVFDVTVAGTTTVTGAISTSASSSASVSESALRLIVKPPSLASLIAVRFTALSATS
jgi:hypothetical protein